MASFAAKGMLYLVPQCAPRRKSAATAPRAIGRPRADTSELYAEVSKKPPIRRKSMAGLARAGQQSFGSCHSKFTGSCRKLVGALRTLT